MKRLVTLSILTCLFVGAWVYGQCDQAIDPLAWTTTEDPSDPNEVEEPIDPNDVGDPNEVDDPNDPGE
jgi:hypothetical protein